HVKYTPPLVDDAAPGMRNTVGALAVGLAGGVGAIVWFDGVMPWASGFGFEPETADTGTCSTSFSGAVPAPSYTISGSMSSSTIWPLTLAIERKREGSVVGSSTYRRLNWNFTGPSWFDTARRPSPPKSQVAPKPVMLCGCSVESAGIE